MKSLISLGYLPADDRFDVSVTETGSRVVTSLQIEQHAPMLAFHKQLKQLS